MAQSKELFVPSALKGLGKTIPCVVLAIHEFKFDSAHFTRNKAPTHVGPALQMKERPLAVEGTLFFETSSLVVGDFDSKVRQPDRAYLVPNAYELS